MSADSVIDLLKKQSVKHLQDMRAQLSATIDDAQGQIALVDRALADKGAPVADEAQTRSTTTAGRRAVGKARAVRKATPRRRRSSKRDAIIAIIASDLSREWAPAQIRNALAERGTVSTAEAIRVQLRRMHEGGDVARRTSGWTLPAPAATSSATGADQASANGDHPVAEETERQGSGAGTQ